MVLDDIRGNGWAEREGERRWEVDGAEVIVRALTDSNNGDNGRGEYKRQRR